MNSMNNKKPFKGRFMQNQKSLINYHSCLYIILWYSCHLNTFCFPDISTLKSGYSLNIPLLLNSNSVIFVFFICKKVLKRIMNETHKLAKPNFQDSPFLSKWICKCTDFCIWVSMPSRLTVTLIISNIKKSLFSLLLSW